MGNLPHADHLRRCATLVCGSRAMAQPYPNRPITLIVPYGAGDPLDTLTRMFSDKMRVPLGQALVMGSQ
jgi:tripartite-type tricarboxylate transporter receptor subunit TctC